jgi:SPP1 family predicted phage head-tail adaptor
MARTQPKYINRYPWMIDSGRLRSQIQICSNKTSAQDAFGQTSIVWTPYLTTWAEIIQLSGQELFQGDEFTSAAQVRITIRSPWPQQTINVGDRIFFGSHCYVIQIINDIAMRNLVMELTCLEIDGSS